MRLVVEVIQGPGSGRTVVRTPGRLLQVGRSTWADLPVAADPALADLHFLVECMPDGGYLRDLGTASGTWLNGSKVEGRAPLRDGDRIRAGGSEFLVRFQPEPAVADDRDTPETTEVSPGSASAVSEDAPLDMAPRDEGRAERVVAALRRQPGRLFTILDAARSPEVLALLIPSTDLTYQSLYEGPRGEELAAVAPYLVEVPDGSPLLETLARRAWGKSWGVYLTCDRPFAEVRKHLRRFLMVELEGGRRVYFRFYDPRVLRAYLPTCNVRESREFFGPIRAYLLESDDPGTLLACAAGPEGVHSESTALNVPGRTVAASL